MRYLPPETPRPMRDGDEDRVPRIPFIWPGQLERCKLAIAAELAAGPIEERRFHHLMLRRGWGEDEVMAARVSLGVGVLDTLVLPDRGRVRMIALPGQVVRPIIFTGRVHSPEPMAERPVRLGGCKVS